MKLTLVLKIKGYDKPLPGSRFGPGVLAVQEVRYDNDHLSNLELATLLKLERQLIDEIVEVEITGFPCGKEEGK